MSKKIMLVEDEQPIREMLRYALTKQGYQVFEAESANQAREMLLTTRPDLLVVDWMMPGESGVELIKRIKADQVLVEIPVIMLTARAEETDKVKGLDKGADDYMTKPVAIREFLARIKALLRRASSDKGEPFIELLGIKIHTATHQLFIDDKRVNISSAELNLLKFFISHKNRVFSRTQILDFVWGQGVYLEERTVDVHVLRLRKTLSPFNKQQHLITVRGMGYMLTDGHID